MAPALPVTDERVLNFDGRQSFADRVLGEAGYGVNVQFLHQLATVRFDRLGADAQAGGDFLVGLALGQELQHLALLDRERREATGSTGRTLAEVAVDDHLPDARA